MDDINVEMQRLSIERLLKKGQSKRASAELNKLIKNGNIEQARAILRDIKHPEAKRWLKLLEQRHPSRSIKTANIVLTFAVLIVVATVSMAVFMRIQTDREYAFAATEAAIETENANITQTAYITEAIGATSEAIAMTENALLVTTGATQNPFPTGTPLFLTGETEELILEQIKVYYLQLLADTEIYLAQLSGNSSSIVIDCDPNLVYKPPRHALSDPWRFNNKLITIVKTLDSAHDMLESIQQAIEHSCNTGTVLTAEQILDLATKSLAASIILSDVEDLLILSGVDLSGNSSVLETPQTTLSALNIQIDELNQALLDMLGTRGAAMSIQFYWEQTVNSGQVYQEGCDLGELSIPDDYILPSNLQGVSPSLDLAVQNYNVGLQALRQSHSAFFAACAEGTVPDNAANRLTQANLANNVFLAAQIELDSLDN